MSSLKSIIVKYFTSNKLALWITLLVILLILATLYAYNNFFIPNEENKKFKNISNDAAGTSYAYGNGKSVIIYYFTVDWCPYCKNSKDDWANFAANYNGRVMNGFTITCKDVNCTDPKSKHPDDVQEYIDKYDIIGYPTVKMVKNGKVIDFDAKVTNVSLTKFVETIVNNPKDNSLTKLIKND